MHRENPEGLAKEESFLAHLTHVGQVHTARRGSCGHSGHERHRFLCKLERIVRDFSQDVRGQLQAQEQLQGCSGPNTQVGLAWVERAQEEQEPLLHLAQVAQVVQQQQLVHWVLLGLVVQQQQLVHWVLLGLGVVHLEEAKEAEHHLLEQLETALQS